MAKEVPNIVVGDMVKLDTSDMPSFVQRLTMQAMRRDGLNYYGTFEVTDLLPDEDPNYTEEFGPYVELNGVQMFLPAIDFVIVEEAI